MADHIYLRNLPVDAWFTIVGYDQSKKFRVTDEYDWDTEGGKHDRRICLDEAGKEHALDMDSCKCLRFYPEDEALKPIAKECLGVEHWETRNLDRLDFHDVSVGSIRKALRAAYKAGKEAK